MPGGPQPRDNSERWLSANQIAKQIQHHFGGQLLALGVFGSLARGSDGPYSDIEMHCIVKGEQIETCFEWSTGPWKAEVDVYSPDITLADAAFVDGDWSITHGAYVQVKPIYDPGSFFDKLREIVLTQPDFVFRNRMEEVIVGDIYEIVGKIRNACTAQSHTLLAVYATKLAVFGACLLGLRYRTLYTSMGQLFQEALALPDLPDGFTRLIELCTTGDLRHPTRILEITDQFWLGIEIWAERNNLKQETSLSELLSDLNRNPAP